MSAVPRLLADTVHNCRRGSKMQDSTWQTNAKQTKDTTVVSPNSDEHIKTSIKRQRHVVSYYYTKAYLSKVSLTSVQRNHWWIMGGQHLPEEGQGLCERASWSQVCRWKLHLPNNKGSSLWYMSILVLTVEFRCLCGVCWKCFYIDNWIKPIYTSQF